MPAPDPHGIWIEENEDGRIGITAEMWRYGNRGTRKKRMLRVLRQISRDGWLCTFCRKPIPIFRRSDARYCRERCRKAAARLLRRKRLERDQDSRPRVMGSYN